MRYFLDISYLGTNFHGWQRQPNANSIQEEIEKALSLILRKPISIMGSSRTDAGVHAKQQFAHFDAQEALKIPLKDLTYKLNSFLNNDIGINKIYLLEDQKHTRFDAIGRKYIYRIATKKDPFYSEISWQQIKSFDISKMNKLEGLLLDHTNFQCFSKVKTEVFTYECTIEQAKWVLNENILEFHIQANRFLRGMVRAIVGTALEFNYNKITFEEYKNILESKNRNNAGASVPAKGLTLEQVLYPENYFENGNNRD